MPMMQQDPAAILEGAMEASDKVTAIINNLEIVKEQVAAYLDSRNTNFLELKFVADSCAGQISQAVSTALSLQGKQTDLVSCIAGPSTRANQQIRAITLDIQQTIGGLNMLTSSLKQSFDRLKELSEPFHASDRKAGREIRTNVEAGLSCLAAVVGLVIGMVSGPIVGGVAMGVLMTGLRIPAPSITDAVKGMVLPRIDWDAALCHIDGSRETVTNIQTTEQGLRDHVSETLTFLDEHEEMKRELQMLKAKMRSGTV